MPLDSVTTHRQSGLAFDYEEGSEHIVVRFPPDVEKNDDGVGYVTVDVDAIRELGKFLTELADKADSLLDNNGSHAMLRTSHRNIDIPF